MSQKYSVSLADYKYNTSPSQLPPNTLIDSSPRTLASPKPLPMVSTQATYHQAPSSPRDSVDSNDEPSDSARLIAPPSHAFTVNIPPLHCVPLLGLLGPPNQPEGYKSLSFYPTAITRITCIILICVSMGLYVPGGVTRCRLAIAALSLALPRNLFAILFRTQRARPALVWSVWGIVNAAIDAIVFTLLLVGIHLAYHNHYSPRNGNNPENVAGSVVGWVAA